MRISASELGALTARIQPIVSKDVSAKVSPSITPDLGPAATWIATKTETANLAALDSIFELPLLANMSGTKTQVEHALRESGPFADFDRVDTATLEARAPQFQALQERAMRYRAELLEASEKKDIDRLHQIQAAWAKPEIDGMPLLPTKDRIALLQVYHENGRWQDVIDGWYELCAVHPRAAQDEIALESLVTALQKRGEKEAKSSPKVANEALPAALEAGTGIARRAIPEGEINYDTVRGNRFINAEVLSSGIGKTYRLIAQRFRLAATLDPNELRALEPELKVYRRFLEMETGTTATKGELATFAKLADDCSFRYYHAAFGRDHHYYPGWNAYFEAFRAKDQDTVDRLAPLVTEACERAGGANTTDFWTLATYVQLLALEGENEKLLGTLRPLFETANDQWKVDSTLSTVKELKDNPVAVAMTEWLGARLANLTEGKPLAEDWIEKAIVEIAVAAKLPPPAKTIDPETAKHRERTEWLNRNTTNLEPLVNSDMVGGSYQREIGGNAKHGGQIVDTEINRYTRRTLLEVLETHLEIRPELEKAGNFWELLGTIQQYVRKQLNLIDADGKPTVEDLGGPFHHVLDGVNLGLIDVSRVQKGGDTSTNLVHVAAGGYGDCRPTDLLLNYGLVLALAELKHYYRSQAYHADGESDVQANLQKLEQLSEYQVAGATVRIWANMQIKRKYEYDLDAATGLPKPSKDFANVEDHTFTVLWEKDDNGLVKFDERGPIVYAIDGFYQDEVYQLGKRRLYLTEVELGTGEDRKKRLVFDAGDMLLRNSEGGAIKSYFEFTPYSGTGVQKRLGAWAGASLVGIDGPETTAQEVVTQGLRALNEAISHRYWERREQT